MEIRADRGSALETVGAAKQRRLARVAEEPLTGARRFTERAV